MENINDLMIEMVGELQNFDKNIKSIKIEVKLDDGAVFIADLNTAIQ